jgi:hypothetical protein
MKIQVRADGSDILVCTFPAPHALEAVMDEARRSHVVRLPPPGLLSCPRRSAREHQQAVGR